MSRLHWEDLPAEVRDALCRACGPVVKAETAMEGIMPGVAVRLHLEDGSGVFCKAIAEDHPAAFLHRRQEWAGRVLPAQVPTPRLVWSARTAGWIVLVHEYLDDARCADLTPVRRICPPSSRSCGRWPTRSPPAREGHRPSATTLTCCSPRAG